MYIYIYIQRGQGKGSWGKVLPLYMRSENYNFNPMQLIQEFFHGGLKFVLSKGGSAPVGA